MTYKRGFLGLLLGYGPRLISAKSFGKGEKLAKLMDIGLREVGFKLFDLLTIAFDQNSAVTLFTDESARVRQVNPIPGTKLNTPFVNGMFFRNPGQNFLYQAILAILRIDILLKRL